MITKTRYPISVPGRKPIVASGIREAIALVCQNTDQHPLDVAEDMLMLRHYQHSAHVSYRLADGTRMQVSRVREAA